MTPDPYLAAAYASLDDSAEALDELAATCCVPGRSPRMAELSRTIAAARDALDGLAEGESADPVMTALEDAGGQVGRLQIGCCAPNRLPLYARILEDLTTAGISLGTMH